MFNLLHSRQAQALPDSIVGNMLGTLHLQQMSCMLHFLGSLFALSACVIATFGESQLSEMCASHFLLC